MTISNYIHNKNPGKYEWSPMQLNMLPETFKSTNASFYLIIKLVPPVEASSGSFIGNSGRDVFLKEQLSKEKTPNESLIVTPMEHLKATLGVNISETAEILQVTRQAIYDWKSGNAIPTAKNQERINKLISLCRIWENFKLGPIRHLIRQNVWGNNSLYDLLCRDELDEISIKIYFDKIKAYLVALNKEKDETKKIKDKYGFKQLNKEEKLKKLKQDSRKIG